MGIFGRAGARCHRYSGTAVRTESSGNLRSTRKPKKQSATRNPRSSSRLRSGCANCCNPRAWTVGRRPPAARACTSRFRSAATSVTTPRACIATGWRNAWKRQLPLVTRPRQRRQSATSLYLYRLSAQRTRHDGDRRIFPARSGGIPGRSAGDVGAGMRRPHHRWRLFSACHLRHSRVSGPLFPYTGSFDGLRTLATRFGRIGALSRVCALIVGALFRIRPDDEKIPAGVDQPMAGPGG